MTPRSAAKCFDIVDAHLERDLLVLGSLVPAAAV